MPYTSTRKRIAAVFVNFQAWLLDFCVCVSAEQLRIFALCLPFPGHETTKSCDTRTENPQIPGEDDWSLREYQAGEYQLVNQN